MAEKGKKDKGKKERQKNAKLTLKEKRKKKREKDKQSQRTTQHNQPLYWIFTSLYFAKTSELKRYVYSRNKLNCVYTAKFGL